MAGLKNPTNALIHTSTTNDDGFHMTFILAMLVPVLLGIGGVFAWVFFRGQ